MSFECPSKKTMMVRSVRKVTEEQRRAVLKKFEYNVFNFPADLLNIDYLSDSGTSSMYDTQWAALMLGDESYGRNRGYYLLLDSMRDVIERGDKPKLVWKKILANDENAADLINEIYGVEDSTGFIHAGSAQLHHPNAFITPQGRCAEYLLFSTMKDMLMAEGKKPNDHYIISNGFFDTTGAHVAANQFRGINLFDPNVILSEFDVNNVGKINPFKGNLNIAEFKNTIDRVGGDKVAMLVMTITNNSAAGQPVSLENIREASKIAHAHGIPVLFDACRFAENCYFIQQYEAGYKDWSVRRIAQEVFKYADVLTFSLKKDGVANMGGFVCFRDDGYMTARFPGKADNDLGHLMKEKQILTFGNDSYGGMSGRDLMALTVGLTEVMNQDYLHDRISQVQYLAVGCAKAGIPVVLPPGGHGIYLDMDRFFKDVKGVKPLDFPGVGLTIELLAKYGIRACELGPFAFEWDQKVTEEEKKSCVMNLVRLAVPRNMYSREHMDYTIQCLSELYVERQKLPKVKITYGQHVRLRHFQAGLEPIYP